MSGSGISPTMRALARGVLAKNLGVGRGENVTIETWTQGLPWANAFVLEAYRLQARPVLHYVDEATYWTAVDELPANVLGHVGSHEWASLRETDAYVFLYGPSDSAKESTLPPKKRAALTAYDDEWFRIITKAKVRTVRLDIGLVTPSEAARLNFDTESWTREIVEATLVDPLQFHREGSRLARALKGGERLRITHPNGTDLDLRLRGRRAHVHDGVIDAEDLRNGEGFEYLPSGWVATAIDEHHADGEFVSNVPTASSAVGEDVDRSEPASGGRWTFRNGKLTKFSYETGGDAFARVYNRLPAGKERPGALNIGLNSRIDRLPRLEDQHRGRVTLMIGRNRFLDGSNSTPYFHAYLSLDGATLTVDDTDVVSQGKIS